MPLLVDRSPCKAMPQPIPSANDVGWEFRGVTEYSFISLVESKDLGGCSNFTFYIVYCWCFFFVGSVSSAVSVIIVVDVAAIGDVVAVIIEYAFCIASFLCYSTITVVVVFIASVLVLFVS